MNVGEPSIVKPARDLWPRHPVIVDRRARYRRIEDCSIGGGSCVFQLKACEELDHTHQACIESV